jgi:hypothetical protein
VSVESEIEELGHALREQQRPSTIWRPRLYSDGRQWVALFGQGIADGVVGFGISPELALRDFDEAWKRPIVGWKRDAEVEAAIERALDAEDNFGTSAEAESRRALLARAWEIARKVAPQGAYLTSTWNSEKRHRCTFQALTFRP